MVDALILTDFLFSGSLGDISRWMGKISSKASLLSSRSLFSAPYSSSLRRGRTVGHLGRQLATVQVQFQGWLKKLTQRLKIPVGLATIPLYFWIEKQIKGHGKMQRQHADLLQELQDILFRLTYHLTTVQVALAYDGEQINSTVKSSLQKYQKELAFKTESLRLVLKETKDHNKVLQEGRIYRVPHIVNDYAPIGAAMGVGWIGVRWLLFKNTRGFVTRMTDQFAPGMIKGSALAWILGGPLAENIKQEVMLTAYDFFKLNKAYYQSLLEQNLIRHVLENDVTTIDWEKDVVARALEDETLKETMFYQNEIMELLENVEASKNSH